MSHVHDISQGQTTDYWKKRALNAENQLVEKNRIIAEKERLLEEIGEQLRKLQHAQDDIKWRRRLDAVSFKSMSTPKKKTLSILRDLHYKLPHEKDGFVMIRVNAVVERSDGVSYNTIRRHLRELDADGVIERRYEGDGQGEEHKDTLFVRIDERILTNPSYIDKTISIGQRQEERQNWGGARGKKPTPVDTIVCNNCGYPWVPGHIHKSGICPGCANIIDEYFETPGPAPDVQATPEPTIGKDMQPHSIIVASPLLEIRAIPPVPGWRSARPCTCGKGTWVFGGWTEWEGQEPQPRWICSHCDAQEVSA